MEPANTESIRTGLAKVVRFEVTFDEVLYVIKVRDCWQENTHEFIAIPDYEISVKIPAHEKQNLPALLNSPYFQALKEAWKAREDDCYFEHRSTDRAAFMILNGIACLIPVIATPVFV